MIPNPTRVRSRRALRWPIYIGRLWWNGLTLRQAVATFHWWVWYGD